MPFASITPLVAAVKGLVVNEIREGEGRWRVKSFYMKRIGIPGILVFWAPPKMSKPHVIADVSVIPVNVRNSFHLCYDADAPVTSKYKDM